MTATRIQQVFKLLGKAVMISNTAQGQLDDYQSPSLNMNKQFDAGPKSPLDAYGEMLAVLDVVEHVDELAGYIRQIMDVTQQAITNYLYFLAPELGLTADATVGTILQTLANQMTSTGQTLPQSSPYGVFFNNQYDFTSFPKSDSPTIPAEWVTSDLV